MDCHWITCQECGKRVGTVEEMRNRFCDGCLDRQLRLAQAMEFFARATVSKLPALVLKG